MLLASIDRAEKEQSRVALQDSISSTLAHLSGHMRPCRKLPEVDAWTSSFQEIAFRYKFLVLDGPSQTGKTLFCRSLSLDIGGCLLEVDCASAETPDLSAFEPGRHRMVLCDEASATLVLRYKKLFQASASLVKLATSKTDCHAYEVWAHRVMFVITSNRWQAELNKLLYEDAEWLTRNSVYVRVQQPLWLQSASLSLQGSVPRAG